MTEIRKVQTLWVREMGRPWVHLALAGWVMLLSGVGVLLSLGHLLSWVPALLLSFGPLLLLPTAAYMRVRDHETGFAERLQGAGLGEWTALSAATLATGTLAVELMVLLFLATIGLTWNAGTEVLPTVLHHLDWGVLIAACAAAVGLGIGSIATNRLQATLAGCGVVLGWALLTLGTPALIPLIPSHVVSDVLRAAAHLSPLTWASSRLGHSTLMRWQGPPVTALIGPMLLTSAGAGLAFAGTRYLRPVVKGAGSPNGPTGRRLLGVTAILVLLLPIVSIVGNGLEAGPDGQDGAYGMTAEAHIASPATDELRERTLVTGTGPHSVILVLDFYGPPNGTAQIQRVWVESDQMDFEVGPSPRIVSFDGDGHAMLTMDATAIVRFFEGYGRVWITPTVNVLIDGVHLEAFAGILHMESPPRPWVLLGATAVVPAVGVSGIARVQDRRRNRW